MSTDPEIAAAAARAQVARARLFSTFGEVQERLKPSTLAQDAVDTATQGLATAARKGAEAVRSRPVAAGAIAATVALVLARGWIVNAIRRRNETPANDGGLINERASRADRE